MSRVFKIQFDDTLRRLSFPVHYDESVAGWKFSELETKVKEMFCIPHKSRVVITYTDVENDIVTMGDDEDLIDACIVQGLNPLRLEVKVLAGTRLVENEDKEALPSVTEFSVEGLLTGLFPPATADAIRDILNCYPPCLFTTVPVSVLPQALETFLSTLTGYSDSAQKNEDNQVEAPACSLHKGVQCDGCGMTPISGPRYKSMKKLDFDLCSRCFSESGNKADYHRMDRPMVYKNHCRMGGGHQRVKTKLLRGVFSRGPYGRSTEHTSHTHPLDESLNGILDSQFVQDVTILDGTELAPGTKFTKIWRLRNVGTLTWPQETQLVYIGGDILGPHEAVNLELVEGGLPPGNEMDVSVDLITPLNAGRYVSHWCLMAPSGKRFGHRVWVLIQVVLRAEQMPQGQEFFKDPYFEDNASCQDSVMVVENTSSMEVQSVGDIQLLLQQSTEVDIDGGIAVSSLSVPFTINKEDVEIPYSAGFIPDPDEQHGEENSELGVFSIVEKPVVKNATNHETVGEYELLTTEPMYEEPLKLVSQVVPQSQVGHVEGIASGKLMSVGTALAQKDILQETALEKLESMGFVQHDLNIELLQKNNYNLQQTIQDIVACSGLFTATKEQLQLAVTYSGWDHMLKDLQELGFEDMQANRRLLFKNEGSVKRVVKELVEMEKQMGGGKGKEKAA